MWLSDHDLQQMDDEYLEGLSAEGLGAVSKRLCQDLKEARERLKQTPQNSSRPPSSREPWLEVRAEGSEEAPGSEWESQEAELQEEASLPEEASAESEPAKESSQEPKQAGKPPGAPGYGRTQVLKVSGEELHRAPVCAACGQALGEQSAFVARTGH